MAKTLNHLVDMLATETYGMTLSEAHALGKCIKCKHVVMVEAEGEFHDDESRKGYELSGLCQHCQDSKP